MTNDALTIYYAQLLILQYQQKPNAFATIKALASLAIINQLPLALQNAFSVDAGQGVQLDAIGKYVGVTRSGNGFFGPITLDDVDFIALIKIAIFTNNAGSSLATIQQLFFMYFPGEILVFDYQSMHLSYFINSSIGSQNLVQLLVTEGLLPKPMGVGISSIVYAPNILKFFGFRTVPLPAVNSSPFNTIADYSMNSPWLNKSYFLSA